ncbi:MAG: hypothetical protein ABS46_13510 [Cytophagaceae bacterium SCN 52-12]|nr:MAG: hypothetical protein ABS46_13510 [Cytophagaceae bacterium SCN 52-12]
MKFSHFLRAACQNSPEQVKKVCFLCKKNLVSVCKFRERQGVFAGAPEPVNLRFGPKPIDRNSLPQPDKMPEAPVTMVILGRDDYHPEPQRTAKAIDCSGATIRALF